ncbi:MAG: response regulator transcription factor [Bacteroidales bacterium]|nr:response regulator transcription factor [Bacteroidales bacterium]
MINVLIADDHQIIIDGIKITLLDVRDINIISEAKDGYQVLKILENQPDVDVILMDINMPKLDGIECTQQVHKRFPQVKVISLSQFSEKRFVKRMIKSGAMGYILKDSERDILVKAIKTVFAGEKYFCDRLSFRLASSELKLEDTKSLFPKLTERETEILNLIGKEYSSTEIADRLHISFHTVESHRSNLILKAGVKNTAGLILWAVRNDLIE